MSDPEKTPPKAQAPKDAAATPQSSTQPTAPPSEAPSDGAAPTPKLSPAKSFMKKISIFEALSEAQSSKDQGLNRAARIFWASFALCLVFLILFLFVFFKKPPKTSVHGSAESENPHSTRFKGGISKLGSFTIQLLNTKVPGDRSEQSYAEMEIVVQCDTIENCKWIDENIAPVRDTITSHFQPMERMFFISPDGKMQLKNELLKKLRLKFKDAGIQEIFLVNILLE